VLRRAGSLVPRVVVRTSASLRRGRARVTCLIFVIVLVPSGWSSASCVAPYVESTTTRLRPGQELRFSGGGWVEACGETGEGGGCTFRSPRTGLRVRRDIEVALIKVRGYQTHMLGDIDASPDGTLQVSLTVPPDVPPGRYELAVEGYRGEPIVVTVLALRR